MLISSSGEAGGAPSSSLSSSVTTYGLRGLSYFGGLGPSGLYRDSMESCSPHPSPSSASEQDSSELGEGGVGLSGLAGSAGSRALVEQAGVAANGARGAPQQQPQHAHSLQQQNTQQNTQQQQQRWYSGSNGGGGGGNVDLEYALEAIMHMEASPGSGLGHAGPVGSGGGGGGHKSFAAAARASGRSAEGGGVAGGGMIGHSSCPGASAEGLMENGLPSLYKHGSSGEGGEVEELHGAITASAARVGECMCM